VEIEFDPAKSEHNRKRRGFSFEIVQDFDWTRAFISEDRRFNYPERRFQALGFVAEVLHMVVYANRESGIRVISVRRASRQERKRYAQTT
jgi:uncharacterized DUF497 family protein